VQLTATLRDAANNILNNRQVEWTSSNPNLATVSNEGLVSGRVVGGPVTITATCEGRSATASVTVVPPVASVSLSATTADLAVGSTLLLVATARDQNNLVLTGRTATWTTSNSTSASVSTNGLVTALAPGTVTITVTIEGRTATATITTGVRGVYDGSWSGTTGGGNPVSFTVVFSRVRTFFVNVGRPANAPCNLTWTASPHVDITTANTFSFVFNLGTITGSASGTFANATTASGAYGSTVYNAHTACVLGGTTFIVTGPVAGSSWSAVKN
jgi:hypothetical protein